MARQKIHDFEFISIMALLMSLAALAIDSMLPALNVIGTSLGNVNPNDNQLIVSFLFLGMSGGLIFFGPLADSYGRKKMIYLGMIIFIIGCLVSIFANTFQSMLFGRLLQGFGAASTRVLSLTMIRDRFDGKEMARVMSLVLVMFMIVPAVAPMIGQAILLFFPWQAIFLFLLFTAIITLLWLGIRQEETLKPKYKKKFSLNNLLSGTIETLKHPISRNYTIISGIISGSFIGYLNSVQQILQVQYSLGEKFPLYFGTLAIAIGIASFINSKLVMKFDMKDLCFIALIIVFITSTLFFIYSYFYYEGHPPLYTLISFLIIIFFCFGVTFGNYNSLAIQPLAHIAGIGNSVIGSVQTLISVLLGGYIGSLYDGSISPLVMGFITLSLISILISLKVDKKLRAV